jgi:hypothetical protein
MGLDNDDIKQLIAILQRGLSEDTKEEAPKKSKTTKKVKTASNNQKPVRPNRFDTMPEKQLHKDDILIDQKLIKNPPTPRREAFVPLQMVCRVCGKTEAVNPSMIESADRFKCNKCAISAG